VADGTAGGAKYDCGAVGVTAYGFGGTAYGLGGTEYGDVACTGCTGVANSMRCALTLDASNAAIAIANMKLSAHRFPAKTESSVLRKKASKE
jgi:hypothetical protein